ncbi:unnamed protein product [Musa acuminata subsp. malaccensis]|uniref:(wild Malaysian banana) hypothetical protein n=1 Tax=Musa acuminata subsp. malaccensis TaxID=214687 RepID=A0A804L5Q7_MUSAM|nr:PREDICTED: uncharacterized protein LOC103970755 [Musa acuminata subsp. malaccensis]CAG1863946.1 unnamed protein product [Musa acuminata subsp. malaccensis]
MDCEPEELQFLGVVGIYREAAKILARWRRLFVKIAGALVLPLSILFFVHIAISHRLFSTIDSDESALDDAPPGSTSESSALQRLVSDWSAFLLFKGFYLVALLVLALLSTAAVVYSVASIYTARGDLAFRKVLTVVPRVWRRLMVTFLWAFLVLLALNSATIALLVFILLMGGNSSTGPVLTILVVIPLYLVALVYVSVVWHLASVVSVLEDARGLEAMRRSRRLIQGKLLTASVIFVMLNLGFGLVEWAFRGLLVRGRGGGPGLSLGLGLLLLLLLCLVILFALAVQTVVYFVCKSYHHESIDKSNLADHLEAYLGEYVPLKSQDVQMEQLRV